MTQKTNKQLHYFASDGNYGAADNVYIVETTHWTGDDWLELEEAYDLERIDVAMKINAKYHG